MRFIVIGLTVLMLTLCFGIGFSAAQETSIGTLPPARNLTNRISVGYNKQLNFGFIGGPAQDVASSFFQIDSLSTKYWATDRIGVEVMLGYFTAKNNEVGGWGIDIGGKFLYNLIVEDYMSFYTGAGLGVIPVHIDYGKTEDTEVGVQVMAYAGIEFFIQELPNLAFDLEFGIRYIDVDEYAQLSTYGGGFGNFGIRYYF